jgi:hypothetical protein
MDKWIRNTYLFMLSDNINFDFVGMFRTIAKIKPFKCKNKEADKYICRVKRGTKI